MLVQKILFVMVGHPLRQNRSAAADDSRDALGHHRNILHQQSRMNCEVVDALLGLLFDYFQVDVDVQVFELLHAIQRLINRHRPDRHGRIPQDRFANGVNVAAGRKIHHSIRPIVDGSVQLAQLFVNVRCDGGVADVCVDLAL